MKNSVGQNNYKRGKAQSKEQLQAKTRREKQQSQLNASSTLASTGGPNKLDLVQLILEQSQKITKLESKLKKNELENVVVLGQKELHMRQLLESATSASDGDVLEFQDKAGKGGAEMMTKQEHRGASGKNELI